MSPQVLYAIRDLTFKRTGSISDNYTESLSSIGSSHSSSPSLLSSSSSLSPSLSLKWFEHVIKLQTSFPVRSTS